MFLVFCKNSNSFSNLIFFLLQATVKASAENSNEGDASSSTTTDFSYEEEGVHFTFKASPGGYICCFCGNPQKRLMTHLQSKNSLCQGRITSMSTISSNFKSFSSKKRQDAHKAMNPESSKERDANRKAKNPGSSKERQATFKSNNPESSKEREANRKAKNPESSKERQATFKSNNPESSKEREANRKAKNPESSKKRRAIHKATNPEDEAKRQKLCRVGRSTNTTVKRFQEATMYSCIFICACCYLRKFRNQVDLIDDKLRNTFTKKAPTALNEFVIPEGSEEFLPDIYTDIGKGPQAWLCGTCKGYLLRNKMPPNCHKNNLDVKPSWQDDPETALTQLEAHLISRNIQFQFIRPKGRSR